MPNIPKLRLMLARMEKSASWMDMVQRAIAKLPTRILPTRMQSASRTISTPQATIHAPQVLQNPPKPQVIYRGYLGYEPEGTEGILHASLHPSVASDFTSDMFKLKNGTNLISRFEVNPQTQKHYLDYGLLGALKQGKKTPLGNPLYHGVPKYLKEQDPATIAFRNTGRTVPEIQQFLEKNPHGSFRGGFHRSFEDFTYETGIPNSYPYMRNSIFAGMSGYNPATKEISDIPHNIFKDLIKGAGVTKEELIHAYKANDPAMRILSQSPVLDKDFLYHASGKKFDALDPKYNSKRSYGHEYTEPVVFAGDAPSSAFASNPTAEYQAVKDKMKDSVYHRLIDELTGRKALLGHTPGGYLYKLPASAFTRIDREDNELGKWNKSTEYVSHRPVKPISVTPMQSTDVDAIPEYEYLGKDFVGEMPAQHYLKHAKNPKVIAAIQAWLANKQEKEAGIADIANRALSALIKSPVTPSFVKNTFYPGFPAVREALRATGRLKTIVPSTGVGDIPTFAVRGENSPAFKALKSQFKTMVPENQTPEGVFDKITTEMSGTPLQRTYSGFVAKNQAKADFKHEPWGEVYNAPMGHYRPRTNVVVNFVENNDTMRHELAHALQYQLPNNFNSLHTLSTGTKLPVIPRSGWTTVRGTRAPSGSSFLQEMNANAAMSRTPLGQMGRAIGYATDPERARAYASRYTPTEKLIHNTLSFPRDIPRRVKAMPGQLMDWIDSKILPPNLTKGAGVFTASGNKVQGVGLRKLYHSLLDERGLTGLGVNNEDTGDVELSFDGDEARRKEVFKELAARIRAKTNHPVTFAPTTVPQTSTPVKLSNKDSERLNAIHHLAYRMSNMYDPADPLMDPNDTFKQKLADRFRLQVNKRGLTGTVPSRAAEQLLGTRPMYAGMMPARRTRSEAEALSDMPMTQQQRLLKALKSGRGFLAPVVDKLASAKKELVRVKLDNDEGKSLMHHYLNAKKWNYPAGKAEPNETLEDAAIRELMERTGYNMKKNKLKYNGFNDGFHQYSGLLADIAKISPAYYETGEPRQLSWGKVPDDVLIKHANLARLGMAAAKSLYGLGSAAVKSPIAQNIATGASNLVNRAGDFATTAIQSPMAQNIATRAGNLANTAVQSRAGKTLITGAEKLHEGTVNLANRAIQNPIVSRLYAGANDLTNAAIQSPMTPDFIKNTFKPGYEAGRQALRRTSRQWVPNWDEPTKGFRLPPKAPVSSSPDRVFRQYKVETTPLMPPSTNGVYWTGGRNQISVRGPRGTESGMRVMRHELTHGLQHQLPSNFNSLQTASVNSPFAGSFLREMNANAAMSRTPLGQMGRAIGYATSPERLKAYWNGYKPMDKLMHGAAVGTAYGVPLAAATVAGGVGTYEGLHSLASRMQPTDLPHNPEFAQAGPPNLNTEESFPEEVA